MKKIVFILAALAIISCKEEEKKPEYVIINGTIQNNNSETAKIRGYDMDIEIPISETGTFTDTLDIKKNGYYDLIIGRERTSTYLEKGKNLSVSVDPKEFDETIAYTGDLAAENNYLAAKYLLSEKGMSFKDLYSLPEEDFVKEINAMSGSYKGLVSKTAELSESFIGLENKELEYEHIANLENYPEYHSYFTGNDSLEVSPGFYDITSKINYMDTVAFRNSKGYREMLSVHYGRLVEDANDNSEDFSRTVTFLSVVDENLPNGYAKDQLMFDHLRYGLQPDSNLEEAYAKFKSSNTNQENLDKITKRYNKLKPLLTGNISPTFDYENHKGGSTSLADLAGKYVYVDVWATWCGPCIREIPSLKEIEKDYHGKNIEFVSISIDEAKDYDTWREMVIEKELGGVQLMADHNWDSKFVDDYGILGIPRFILIDPEGKIVSADAPRPSDPKLRKMLDELI